MIHSSWEDSEGFENIQSKRDRVFAMEQTDLNLMKKGKFAKAEAVFQKTIYEEQLHTCATFTQLGTSKLAQGRTDETIPLFLMATNCPFRNPRNPAEDKAHLAKAYSQLGNIYKEQKGDKSKAKEYFRQALRAKPDHQFSREMMSVL